MLRILGVMLLIITVSNAVNQLYDDICSTVLETSASSRVAMIVCNADSVMFDPTSQNGAFLFNNETDRWEGEIFACQCSCSLPDKPQDGWILTNGRVQHGKSLEYDCDSETKHTEKILCLDGLLMMVPNILDNHNISTAFRQKSVPKLYNFQNAIFQLSVNQMSDWSFDKSEVRNNQKYTQILTENDTSLKYYLFNGNGFKIGTIELKMESKLECSKRQAENISIVVISCVFAILGVSIIIIIIIIVRRCPEKFRICLRRPVTSKSVNNAPEPTATTSVNETKEGMELTAKGNDDLDNPSKPLMHETTPSFETPATVDRSALSID